MAKLISISQLKNYVGQQVLVHGYPKVAGTLYSVRQAHNNANLYELVFTDLLDTGQLGTGQLDTKDKSDIKIKAWGSGEDSSTYYSADFETDFELVDDPRPFREIAAEIFAVHMGACPVGSNRNDSALRALDGILELLMEED